MHVSQWFCGALDLVKITISTSNSDIFEFRRQFLRGVWGYCGGILGHLEQVKCSFGYFWAENRILHVLHWFCGALDLVEIAISRYPRQKSIFPEFGGQFLRGLRGCCVGVLGHLGQVKCTFVYFWAENRSAKREAPPRSPEGANTTRPTAERSEVVGRHDHPKGLIPLGRRPSAARSSAGTITRRGSLE